MTHILWFVHGQSYIDVMRPQMFLFIMDGENLDSEWYNTSQKTYRRKESLLDEHSLGFATYCYKNNITRKVIAGKGKLAQELGSNKSCLRSVISFPDPTTHLIYTLEGMRKNSGNAR